MSNKENIVQAALELFGEQGYDRTATKQIAQRAGVSEGLIFRHFGNKAALLAAIIEAGMGQIAATMRPYSELADDPRGAILRHVEQSLALIREHEAFWQMATKIRFQQDVYAVAGAQIEMVNRFIVGQLTDNFKRLGAQSPEQEALLLFALIDGVCLHWLQDTERYPLDDMKSFIIQHYANKQF